MQRRSFFRSLALMAGAASVSPMVFIPKFEPVRWKPIREVRGVTCDEFVRFLCRKSEELDEEILRSLDPLVMVWQKMEKRKSPQVVEIFY